MIKLPQNTASTNSWWLHLPNFDNSNFIIANLQYLLCKIKQHFEISCSMQKVVQLVFKKTCSQQIWMVGELRVAIIIKILTVNNWSLCEHVTFQFFSLVSYVRFLSLMQLLLFSKQTQSIYRTYYYYHKNVSFFPQIGSYYQPTKASLDKIPWSKISAK